MQSIPIFRSHHSIGRSILTLEKKGDSVENGPDSIIDLAIENNLKKVFLIETSYSGIIEAYQNLSKEDIKLFFGLQLVAVEDSSIKDDDSLKTQHKVSVVALNKTGENILKKIYTNAAVDGFYYTPRISLKFLRENWSEHLRLWIPFYDSYVYENAINARNIVPNFGKIPLHYIYEDNYLPIDTLIQTALEDKPNLIKAKTILYKNRKDFGSYLAFRCIQNRSTVSKPQLDGMSSDEFCMQSWQEQNN